MEYKTLVCILSVLPDGAQLSFVWIVFSVCCEIKTFSTNNIFYLNTAYNENRKKEITQKSQQKN